MENGVDEFAEPGRDGKVMSGKKTICILYPGVRMEIEVFACIFL